MFFAENRLLELFQSSTEEGGKRSRGYEHLKQLNTLMWYFALCSLLVAFLTPVLNASRHNFLVLMCKAGFFALALQPFVALAHGRYYVGLIPVVTVFATLCLAGDLVRVRSDGVREPPDRILLYLDWILLLLLVTVIVVLLL